MDRWGQAKPVEWSEAPSLLRPGTTLGRYELLLPIGFGGMACVWAARLIGYGGFSKLVAVKTILPHLANNTDFERMLLDEARIAADVHHANVCNLYDVGEDQGVLYLVMEWVNGDSLLHLLRQGPAMPREPLVPAIAARIVADACAGLHAAHELCDGDGRPLHVVHRDVSPHNILVSLEGGVKIADFGVAKANGQLHQTTRAGEVKGKIAYMAPEQINGAPIDRRADVFGMGCVLYEATIGQQPFSGDNEAHVIRRIIDGIYEPPRLMSPDYSPDLAEIVERCLDPNPDERFQTAMALHTALEEWLARNDTARARSRVAEVVRARIGPKLEGRAHHVRVAMERRSDTTRPTAAPGQAAALAPVNTVKRSGFVPLGETLRMDPPMGTLPPPVPPPHMPGRGTPSGATAVRNRPTSGFGASRVWKIAMAAAAGLLTVVVAQAIMAARSHKRPVDVTAVPADEALPVHEIEARTSVPAPKVPDFPAPVAAEGTVAHAMTAERPPAAPDRPPAAERPAITERVAATDHMPSADADASRRPAPASFHAAAPVHASPSSVTTAATATTARAVLPANPY